MRKLFVLSVLGGLLAVLALAGSDLKGQTDSAEAVNWNTTTVRWGPYTVPAMDEQENFLTTDNCWGLGGILLQLLGGVTCVNRTVPLPCTNCYIGAIIPNLVYSDGTTANHDTGVMLHHMVLMSRARGDPTCPPNLFGGPIQQLGALMGGNERVFASGNERTIMDMTDDGYGYRVGSSDKWMLITDLMNMMDMAQTVYLEFTFKWTASTVPTVRPLWFDIDNCQDSEIAMAAGYSDTHKDWRATFSGTIIEAGGHGHGEAISTSLQNRSTGGYLCTSVAGYHAHADEMGHSEIPGPGSGIDAGHPVDIILLTHTSPVYSDPRTMGGMHAHDSVEYQSVCEPYMSFTSGQYLRIHQQYNQMEADPDNMGIMMAFVRPN